MFVLFIYFDFGKCRDPTKGSNSPPLYTMALGKRRKASKFEKKG
jgi:hypothetical protein